MDTSSAIAAALSGKQTRIEKVDTPEIMIRKAAQAQSVYSSWRAVLHAHMDTRTAAQKNREAAAAAAALSMAEDGLTVASDQNDDRQLLNISPNLGYLYKAIGKPRKSAFRPTKQRTLDSRPWAIALAQQNKSNTVASSANPNPAEPAMTDTHAPIFSTEVDLQQQQQQHQFAGTANTGAANTLLTNQNRLNTSATLQRCAQRVHLEENDRKDLQTHFNLFGPLLAQHGAGGSKLPRSAFRHLLRTQTRGMLSDKAIERVFAVLCLGGNRWMDVSDYIQSVSILIKGSHEDRLKLLFAIFDVDDDQILSAHDLFVALEWQVDTLFSDDMATITRCYELALTREPVVDYPAFRQAFVELFPTDRRRSMQFNSSRTASISLNRQMSSLAGPNNPKIAIAAPQAATATLDVAPRPGESILLRAIAFCIYWQLPYLHGLHRHLEAVNAHALNASLLGQPPSIEQVMTSQNTAAQATSAFASLCAAVRNQMTTLGVTLPYTAVMPPAFAQLMVLSDLPESPSSPRASTGTAALSSPRLQRHGSHDLDAELKRAKLNLQARNEAKLTSMNDIPATPFAALLTCPPVAQSTQSRFSAPLPPYSPLALPAALTSATPGAVPLLASLGSDGTEALQRDCTVAQALAKVPAPTAAIMLTCVPLSLSPLFPSNHPIHANQTSTPWLKTGISDKIDAQINATQQSVNSALASVTLTRVPNWVSVTLSWFVQQHQLLLLHYRAIKEKLDSLNNSTDEQEKHTRQSETKQIALNAQELEVAAVSASLINVFMKVEQKAKQSSTTNTVSNAISSEPSNEAGLIGAVDVGTMIHKLRVEKGISDKIATPRSARPPASPRTPRSLQSNTQRMALTSPRELKAKRVNCFGQLTFNMDNEAEWDQATEARSARLRALDTRDAVDEQLKRITDKSNSTVLFESPFLSPPAAPNALLRQGSNSSDRSGLSSMSFQSMLSSRSLATPSGPPVMTEFDQFPALSPGTTAALQQRHQQQQQAQQALPPFMRRQSTVSMAIDEDEVLDIVEPIKPPPPSFRRQISMPLQSLQPVESFNAQQTQHVSTLSLTPHPPADRLTVPTAKSRRRASFAADMVDYAPPASFQFQFKGSSSENDDSSSLY